MDVEPPTGDDLNRMLVSMKQDVLRRAAAEPPARRRPWARRHLGLTLSLVALLGIGGAGGALALVLPSPFQAAPAASPTPTSSPTPEPGASVSATSVFPTEPPAQPAGPPEPAYAADCHTLGDQIGVGSLVPSAVPTPRAPVYWNARDTALLQSGVLECLWQPEGLETSSDYAIVRVSPAGERGREWISGLAESGLGSLGVGDVSAVSCTSGNGCNASVVAGAWWLELSVGADGSAGRSVSVESVRAAAGALVDTVSAQVPPAAWPRPVTPWSAQTDCTGLPTGAEMGSLTGGPAMDDAELDSFARDTGIDATQRDDVLCTWYAPRSEGVDGDEVDGDAVNVSVALAPGSGWAWGTRTLDGSPVEVAGADGATLVCLTFDGLVCRIDVLVDDTWIQVSGEATQETADRLIPVAEAVVATRAAAGQGDD